MIHPTSIIAVVLLTFNVASAHASPPSDEIDMEEEDRYQCQAYHDATNNYHAMYWVFWTVRYGFVDFSESEQNLDRKRTFIDKSYEHLLELYTYRQFKSRETPEQVYRHWHQVAVDSFKDPDIDEQFVIDMLEWQIRCSVDQNAPAP